MAVWNSLDDAVQTQATQIVRHPACRIVGRIEAQHWRQQGAHFGIGKSSQLQAEHSQDSEERLHTLISEPERRSALAVNFDWFNRLTKRILADRAIVGNLLDVEQTPVSLKADLPQSRQILQSFPNSEVASVVDRRFG